MTTVVQNLRGTRRLRVLATFLPAAVLPLVLMGVTVPGALDANQAEAELRELRRDASEAERLRGELREFGDLSQVEEVRRARDVLRGLLPGPVPELDLFNLVRLVGGRAGLALSEVDVREERDLGLTIEDHAAFARDVEVVGEGTLDQLSDFVAQLRSRGLPVAVLEANLTRGAVREARFQFTVRLGVLHGGPAPAGGATGDDPAAFDPATADPAAAPAPGA